MLNIKTLSVSTNLTKLTDVSFTISSSTALVGQSGSGKSFTLLKFISQIIRFDLDKEKAKKIAEEICKKLLTNIVIEDYTINLK